MANMPLADKAAQLAAAAGETRGAMSMPPDDGEEKGDGSQASPMRTGGEYGSSAGPI